MKREIGEDGARLLARHLVRFRNAEARFLAIFLGSI
jgi:hypothetical protein